MLVQGIMTKNVVTVSSNTSAVDALKIMKEKNFRRLPVVDKKGKLVGLVTESRLERVKPQATTPLLWQMTYLISHTKVSDVMRRRLVTVKPTDTVEQVVAKAQKAKVGTLVVIEDNKIVGICTTNDIFYKVANPTLGIGETGTRILIEAGGKAAEAIIHCINQLGVGIKLIWTSPSSTTKKLDLTLQLDTKDATTVIEELAKLGYKSEIRQR
ncbi:CBS domain-containing protein [Chloroflexota bacterium]